MLSRLKPDSATTVGILTAAGVYLIYSQSVPNVTDVRVNDANDEAVDTARKHAAWLSAALIVGVFVVARDLNSYIISGAALVGVDYIYKHNNAYDPHTGKLSGGDVRDISISDNVVHPLPTYDTA